MGRRRLVGVLALLAALGVTGPLVLTASADRQVPGPVALEWRTCPAEVTAVDPTLQCTTVPVPLDYAEPDAATIDIMISRLASTGEQAHRGVLVTNPGGPGATGLTMPADLVTRGLPAAVTSTYDLIGMDPRGVGHSAPVSCGFTAESPHRGNVPPFAVDTAAVLAQAEVAEQVAADCGRHDTQGWMRHVSTANTARDLDRIRSALGEEQVSYFGTSYGSALGAAYASMFPERTDRVVLDSNVGGTALDHDAMRRYGQGVEDSFGDFARWAALRDDSYGLGRSRARVRQTYLQLAEQLDTAPVSGFDGALFRFRTFLGLYGEPQYPATARLWQSLRADGAAAPAPETVPPVPEPSGTGETPLEPWDNSWSAFLAVTCNDVDWSEDVAHYQRAVEQDRERYPLFGAAGANVNPCAFWPWEPAEPPVPIDDEGETNILVLQNRRDPGTSLTGGQLLRRAFAQRSRMVTVDESGHGVYVYGHNACALNVTTGFLVHGTLPHRDTSCRRTR